MSDTAFQTQYRQEFVQSFEQLQSKLRACVLTESVIKGNTATFLVAGSGGASAVTRGVNGLIPARADDLTQTSATLAEWHDLVRKTDFNIFASQGDQNAIMQQTTMAVLNRKIDDDIIAQLDTATQDTGAATTASLETCMHALAILGNSDVDVEDTENLFAVVTPAFRAYMMQTKEFSSADYVDMKPFEGPAMRMLRWCGFNWITSTRLTGKATSAEKCYFFHRNAIGHAVDKAGLQTPVGYDEEQGYSYARASVNMGSKLLQNTGVVQVVHDGSGFAAS